MERQASSERASVATSNTDFRALFHVIAASIRDRYEVVVDLGPLDPSFSGEFNGKYILVREDLAPDQALYVLLHLFGHTVQWNTDAELRRIGLYEGSGAIEEQLRVHRYEREASEIALGLLRDIGIDGLEQWVSDMFWADWAFLEHYYQTGERLGVESTFAAGQEVLKPREVPAFEPRHWRKAHAF